MAAESVGDRLDETTCDRLRNRVTTVGDREALPVTAPYTNEVVGTVPRCRPADVDAAVDRARSAQSAWAARSVENRATVLERFADSVLANRERLLDVVQVETGKTRLDALAEVLDVVLTADYYAENGPEQLAGSRRGSRLPGLTRVETHHDPVGVAGFVEPWNYPLTLAISDFLPALLAGNTVVLKPAEETPFTALLAHELLVEAGVPEDVVQVVTGEGEPLGEPLVAGVDQITFTGSTETGRAIGSLAGEHLVDASLELGGKNPAIVLADADLDAAVRALVWGSYANAGQLCLSFERIYVEQSVYAEFRDRFVEATASRSLGATFDFGPNVGSLISEAQRSVVETHVKDARARGGTVLTGGKRREDVGPLFYEPTVLADLPAEATAATAETFGPVVTIEPVPDAAAGVRRANATDYGLHASVWTADRERGRSLARQIRAGSVSINDAFAGMWASTDAPMGGVADSGIGRRHGPEGISKFTETQTVTSQRGPPLVPIDAVPAGIIARGAILGIGAVRRLKRRLPPWL
ncbi:succinic semialdehyde dehydrogenase [Haloarcula halophila]|uniref:succinic semialdehyde dehydrogenase n=1 Tax=Haloarcula TaxID=2237 RepID=UPI0023E37952|nr:succinic semialdehyde dehydrogenase [Halomicroarcula sp. DFY41]